MQVFDLDDDWQQRIGLLPVTQFQPSVRLLNCLAKAKLNTWGDVAAQSPAELMKIRNFGVQTLREVLALLVAHREDALAGVHAAKAMSATLAEARSSLTLLDEWQLFGGDTLLAQWNGVGVLCPSEQTWTALDAAGIELLWDLLTMTIREAQDSLGDSATAEVLDLIPEAAELSRDFARRHRSPTTTLMLERCADPPLEDLDISGAGVARLAQLGITSCSALLAAVRSGTPLLLFDLELARSVWPVMASLGLSSYAASDHHRVMCKANSLTLDCALAPLANPRRERELAALIGRHGLAPGRPPLTLANLAQEWGMSREGVRHVETRALGRVLSVGSYAKAIQRSLVWLLGTLGGVARAEELETELCAWIPAGEICPLALIRLLLREAADVTCLESGSVFTVTRLARPPFSEVVSAARRLWQRSSDNLAGDALLAALAAALDVTDPVSIEYLRRCLVVMYAFPDSKGLGRRPLQLLIVDALREAGRPLTLFELSRRLCASRDGHSYSLPGIGSRASAHPHLIQLAPGGRYWLAGVPVPAPTAGATEAISAVSICPELTASDFETGSLENPRRQVLAAGDWRSLLPTLIQAIESLPVPRSTCELGLSSADVERLADACAGFAPGELADLIERSPSRRLAGTDCDNAEGIGLLLLVYFAEVAREHVSEGRLWRDLQGRLPPVLAPYFNALGYPSHIVRFALDAAARRFQLRHTLDEDAGENWYVTLFLQFGLPRAAYRRAAEWLTSVTESRAATRLRSDPSARTFHALWSTLRAFRAGVITSEEASRRLERSPWLSPHWVPEILEHSAARVLRADRSTGLDEERAVEASATRTVLTQDATPGRASPLESAARVLWREQSERPEVLIPLPPLETLGPSEPAYQVLVNERIVLTVRRAADGGYPHPTHVRVPAADATCLLRILEGSPPDERELARMPQALLEFDEELAAFDGRTGSRVDPWEDALDPALPYLLAIRDGLMVDPPPSRVLRANGWYWAEIAAGTVASTRISLDGVVVWEALLRERLKRPVPEWTRGISVRVEGTTQPRFGEPVDLRVTGLPDGYSLEAARCGQTLLTVSTRDKQPIVMGLVVPVESARRSIKVWLRVSQAGSGSSMVACRVDLDCWGLLVETAAGLLKAVPLGRPVRFSRGHPLRIKVRAPKLPPGELRRWSVFEGGSYYGVPSLQTRELRPKLALGAPLDLRLGMHNADATALPLCGPILDCGEVAAARLAQDETDYYVEIDMRGPLVPRPGHQVRLWMPGQPVRLFDWDQIDDEPLEDGRSQWVVNIGSATAPGALGIAYRGERLGAWFWINQIEATLRDRAAAPAEPELDALKWFRVPVLHPRLHAAVSRWVARNPPAGVCAWLTKPDRDSWLAALRVLLLDWEPKDPSVALAFLSALDHLGEKRTPPIQAVDTLACCLGAGGSTFPARSLAICPLLALKSLRLALSTLRQPELSEAAAHARRAGREPLTEEALLTNAAVQLGTDVGYVQGLARVSRDLVYSVPPDPRQRVNLLLALGSPAFSDYLAAKAAQQTLGWLRSLP